VGFFSDERLLKVPVSGGNVVSITEPASAGAGVFWGEDGMIYYSPSYTDAVHRVPAGGGESDALTSLDADAGDFGHWWPIVLPGNRYLLYSRWHTTVNDCSTWRLDLNSGDERKLLDQACAARYAPPGYLVFSRGSAVAAVRIDAASGEISGDPVVVLDDVHIDPPNGWSPYSISADGTLAYIRDEHFGSHSSLVWVDLQGKMTTLDGQVRDYRGVRISPDGQQLALSIRERTEQDIWIHDIERRSSRRFTVDGTNQDPCWTPDGKRIVFSSMRTGPFDLYWKPLDESEPESLLVGGDHDKTPYQWTPDGSALLFTNDSPDTDTDIWSHSEEGDVVLVSGKESDNSPTISPDGRWLAYASNHSARNEVYVETYPPGGGRWQISTEGGNYPLWSPDGRTLYYWDDDAVFAVEIDTGSGLRAGRPRKLFGDEQLRGRLWRYDLHPDGRRFVVARSEPVRSAPIEIVLGWSDQLRARLP
jgi:serine/threonine-protein kinase